MDGFLIFGRAEIALYLRIALILKKKFHTAIHRPSQHPLTLPHFRAGHPIHPPWESLPYLRRTRSGQAYWEGQTCHDLFWCNIRVRQQAEQPEAKTDMPALEEVDVYLL